MRSKKSFKKRPYIVVVDDDPEMRRMLNSLLKLEGYDVSLAEDGSSAITLLEECRPDLVILDIMMPKLDGFQVLELIRQRTNIPVIMLTAKREVTLLQKALGLGANDYVTKPFITRILVSRIRAKLRRALSEASTIEEEVSGSE